MPTVSEDQLRAYIKEMERAIADSDFEVVVSVMGHFSEWKPTAESLKRTGLGVFLNSIRKHQNATDVVKTLAKDYILRWKAVISKENGSVEINPNSSKESTRVPIERKYSVDSNGYAAADSPLTPSSTGALSLRERSYKLDGLSPRSSGDKMRDKTIELIYAAVGLGSHCESSVIHTTATAIESALFKEFRGLTDKYKSQFRTLVANMKDKENPKLRERILNGEIEPSRLVTMSTEDLMSDELKRAAEEAVRKNLTDSLTAPTQEAETDTFKCGKCNKRKCTYYQKQTRSADEPMTTFVTCVNCGNKWKFC